MQTAAPRRSDVEHGARILFARELTAGVLTDAAIVDAARARAVRAAVAPRRVPTRPERVWQLLRRRRGGLGWDTVADAVERARRAVLGPGATGAPRFLVRVDEFPHVRAWDERSRHGTDAYRRFHAIMAEAGVPYLVAVPTRVSRSPLDPADTTTRPWSETEQALLCEIVRDGATLALHGRDHRTRDPRPRHHSELCGLDRGATTALLDTALAELAAAALPRPEVFVPPYNRFEAAQYAALAERFAVVCGGPESIGLLGFQPPQWREGAHYLPSYAPLYGRARSVLPAAQALVAAARAHWSPITLHWGWEEEAGWDDLRRLVATIAPWAEPWEALLAAARPLRAIAPPPVRARP